MERGGRTMAQKKNESVSAIEEAPAVGSFVETFWDRYELSRERARSLREDREDAYLNAVKEVIKFNKHYRKSVAKLYEQSKKTNKEMVTEMMQQFTSNKDEMKEEVKIEASPSHDREELRKQLREVSGQLEKLALTPIKSTFQIIDQLEDRFEKDAETKISYVRERRNAWLQVRKEYVKLARKAHYSIVDRGMSSIKELVKAR